MKTQSIIKHILFTFTLFVSTLAVAQNYKAPKIDASGKVYDKNGKHIGSVSTTGEISDAAGNKIAHVDSDGELVDAKTGKKLGKAEKNGNFVYHTSATSDGKGLKTNAPMNGTCLVEDTDGHVVAEVHENYKQFGACAIHCLTTGMKHGEVTKKKSKSKDKSCH